MTDRATPEEKAKLRRAGRLLPCYPVREIIFFPETGLAPRHNCYISEDPRFITIWEPGNNEPDLVNTKAVMYMKGKGTAPDGTRGRYCIIPDHWEG